MTLASSSVPTRAGSSASDAARRPDERVPDLEDGAEVGDPLIDGIWIAGGGNPFRHSFLQRRKSCSVACAATTAPCSTAHSLFQNRSKLADKFPLTIGPATATSRSRKL